MAFYVVEISPSGRAVAWSRETLGDLWELACQVADKRGASLDCVDLASPSSIIGFLSGENRVRWAEGDSVEDAAAIVMRHCESLPGDAGRAARRAVRQEFPGI